MNNNHNHWPLHSAGSRMTREVPIALPTQTIADVEKYLEEHISRFETIQYIYVVNTDQKFWGVFSMREFYRFPKKTKIEAIHKKTDLITVLPTTHQEEAAYLALKHNLKAIPVVDAENHFLGVLASNVILAVLHHEMRKDMLHLAGVSPEHIEVDNILEISLWQSIKHRLPWLFLGLIGGIFTAKVVSGFEQTLEKNLILVAFIPLVVYIADAVGTQLEAFTIRDFAIFRKINIGSYIWKQFLIIFTIALILGVSLALILFLLGYESKIPLVLSLAIIAASLSSVLTGIIIPLIFRKLKFDPANASGPIGTIIQDFLSIVIYFAIATALLTV